MFSAKAQTSDVAPVRSRWPVIAFGAGVAFAAFLWTAICSAPGIEWNPPRIAAAFALAQGHSLYPLPTSGAQIGWFYPPVFPLWYWPVTRLDNPTAILVAAALFNFVTAAGGFLVFFRLIGLPWSASAVGAATGIALCAAHRLTAGQFFWLHVDVVCVAWGLVACGATVRWVKTRSLRWLHLAALAATVAVFTKQLAIVLPLALAVWVGVSLRQPGNAVRLLGWCFIYCGLALLACAAHWGTEEIYTSLYLILSQTPYQELSFFIDAVMSLLAWSPLWIGAGWWLLHDVRRRTPFSARSPLALLIWVVLAHLPLGLMAPLKLGAGLNSLHSLPYLTALLATAAALLWRESAVISSHFRLRVAMLWLLCGVLALLHASAFRGEWHIYRGQEEALAQARQHRGKIYFPWNPLITLLSEDRLLPFDNALFCLDAAGMPVPREAVRAAIPRGALLVFPEPSQSQFVLTYLWPTPPAPTK